MDKQRRKELYKASKLIAEAQASIESVLEDEWEAYEDLPENIQYGEKGQKMEGYINILEDACGLCDDLMSTIEEI